jgi:hypothetical protein
MPDVQELDLAEASGDLVPVTDTADWQNDRKILGNFVKIGVLQNTNKRIALELARTYYNL